MQNERPGDLAAAQRRRPDVPHVGLFNRYEDAQEQARFRADITGYRYRVRFEPANRWWQITETVTRFRARAPREEANPR